MAWIERHVVAAAALLLCAAPAPAADQTVLGRLFLVKDPAPDSAPDITKRRNKVIAKEYPSTNTIVGDPTVSGASLRLIANGGTSGDHTYVLASARWTGVPGVAFKYKDDGTYGPIRKVLIVSKNDKFYIKALLDGRIGFLALEPPNPGTDAAATLTINGGDTYCMMFGGAAGGTVINSPPGNPFKLFAIRNPTAENGCPTPLPPP